MTSPAPTLVLDVWSDIVCPWCYIGRTRLFAALNTPDAPAVTLRWRAFELQPDLPGEGVEALPFYAKKFGGEARVKQMFDQVAGVAAQDGLRMDFSKVARAPNTRLGHRIVRLAEAQRAGAGDAVQHALFRAHFVEGVDVARLDAVLAFLADQTLLSGPENALDFDALRAALADGAALNEVIADERMATELGIRGVPMFVAGLESDRPRGVSGAQPADVFRKFLADTAQG
jgi:predicted DsbA family dithiol-disulfide isomerase